MTGYQVYESQTFWDCVASLRRDDAYKGALMDTLVELRRQPFRNMLLQTHDVGKARNGKKIYSSDVGGRRSDRRLVWQVYNKTIVVLLYGTHAVQDRAKRLSVTFDPSENIVTVVEEAPDTGVERDYREQRMRVGRLFMPWTDGELAGSGFPHHVVKVLRTLDNDDQLFELEEALGEELFERAFNLLTAGTTDGSSLVTDDEPDQADEPDVTEEDRELERQLADAHSGEWFTQTEPEVLRDVLGEPIEDWMVFLHPSQRDVIAKNFAGPSRVRGAAGTGKTVVGLHRAVWLAEQNRETGETKPVLFTTYIKTLPPPFSSRCSSVFRELVLARSSSCTSTGWHARCVPRLATRSTRRRETSTPRTPQRRNGSCIRAHRWATLASGATTCVKRSWRL